MTTAHTATPKLKFALGGIVTTCIEDVYMVRREAVKHDRQWLIPQCDSLIRQYKEHDAALAKATGGAQPTAMDVYGPSDLDLANAAVELRDGKRHVLFDRSFLVMARFPDTDEGTRSANQFMSNNPKAAVLEVVGGEIILASNEDKGIPIKKAGAA